jgi:probable phosphoglycerate mutase
MRLFLVRHGQSKSNVGHALDTDFPGAELTDLGHEQAAQLVTRLAGEQIDAVAASSLTRAQQTAAPVAAHRGHTVLTVDDLREIEAGDLEMRMDTEAHEGYYQTVRGWAAGDLDRVMPGARSGHEFLDRYDRAVRALEAAGSSVVAVSHGAAIRTWVAARCRGLEAAGAASPSMANTGVMVLEGSTAGGWQLIAYREELADDLPA